MFGYSLKTKKNRNYIFDFRSPNKFSPVWSKPWKSIPNNLDHLLQFRPDCKRCWRWLVTFSWRSLVHETNPARVQWKLVKKRREISADNLANPLQRVTVQTTYCIHFSTSLPTVIIMKKWARVLVNTRKCLPRRNFNWYDLKSHNYGIIVVQTVYCTESKKKKSQYFAQFLTDAYIINVIF